MELAVAQEAGYDYNQEGSMSEAVLSLGDIPDLSGIQDTDSEPWADGGYEGVIVGKRSFTD